MISQEKLIEAGIVGLLSYMVGTILMKFIKKDDPKNGKPSITFSDKVVMFSIGAIIHLLVKETKVDSWYCQRLSLQSLAKVGAEKVVATAARASSN